MGLQMSTCLSIDFEPVSSTFSGDSNQLELDGPLYVGGLGVEYSPIHTPPAVFTASLRQGFVGCIRDLTLNGKAVDLTAYARQQDSGKFMITLGLGFGFA